MAEFQATQIYTVECPAPRCPAPHWVVRDGWKNQQQRYECKGCGNHFFAEGKALYKQFTAEQIADALDMYHSGMSYKQVAENMEDTYDVPEPSKTSIQAWVWAYTDLARRYLRGEVGDDGTPSTATGKRVLADVGGHWVADEMMVRVGGDRFWNWNVMDAKTRYLLASRLTPTRNAEDAIAVFEQALANAKAPPKKITTDGLFSYDDAVRAVFPRGTQHEVSIGFYGQVNNNLSERLQSSFRQRIKTQRGHQALVSGQRYLDGWTLEYNFFKDHDALGGRTPAWAAGVSQQVPWDKWEDITRLGGQVAEVEVQSHTPVRNGSSPKPKLESVKEAVKDYLDARTVERAHERRQGSRSPAVAAFSRPRSGKRKAGRGKTAYGL